MSVAVHSALDLSTARSIAARRLAVGQGPLREKLDVLRRVLRRDLDGTLPALVETRAEQSWNEQIFARVLNYQTLFSHDTVPYHLQPKQYARGRYNDFSLGFFGGDDDLVLASAELKSPGASLDEPQQSYDGRSAVEQAHEVASKIPSCRWALASNLLELRLYAAGVFSPMATAHLRDVRSSRDLAALLAHFDRAALLGPRNGGEIAMVSSMDPDHPASVVPAVDDSYRVIARFTPTPERERALYEIERLLRQAVVSAPGWFRFIERMDYGREIRLRARLKDGWVAIDGSSSKNNIAIRVAASTAGQRDRVDHHGRFGGAHPLELEVDAQQPSAHAVGRIDDDQHLALGDLEDIDRLVDEPPASAKHVVVGRRERTCSRADRRRACAAVLRPHGPPSLAVAAYLARRQRSGRITSTGRVRVSVVPSPRAPLEFEPQATTPPVARTADR